MRAESRILIRGCRDGDREDLIVYTADDAIAMRASAGSGCTPHGFVSD
jgi:hypothetical protein